MGSIKILIVDDEYIMRESLLGWLERDGYAVDAAGSELLGHDPRKIEYLSIANGVLGSMDDIVFC